MHRTHILWSVCALIAAAISNQAALADEISERAIVHFSSIVLDTTTTLRSASSLRTTIWARRTATATLTFLACVKAASKRDLLLYLD